MAWRVIWGSLVDRNPRNINDLWDALLNRSKRVRNPVSRRIGVATNLGLLGELNHCEFMRVKLGRGSRRSRRINWSWFKVGPKEQVGDVVDRWSGNREDLRNQKFSGKVTDLPSALRLSFTSTLSHLITSPLPLKLLYFVGTEFYRREFYSLSILLGSLSPFPLGGAFSPPSLSPINSSAPCPTQGIGKTLFPHYRILMLTKTQGTR